MMKEYLIENWYSITMICLLLILLYKICVKEEKEEALQRSTREGRLKEKKKAKRRKISIFILFFLAAWLYYVLALLHAYDNDVLSAITYIGLGTVNLHIGKYYLTEYKKGRDKNINE